MQDSFIMEKKSNILPHEFIGSGQGKLPFFAFNLSHIPRQSTCRVTQEHLQRVFRISEEFSRQKKKHVSS
jgi:hypothetical protein